MGRAVDENGFPLEPMELERKPRVAVELALRGLITAWLDANDLEAPKPAIEAFVSEALKILET